MGTRKKQLPAAFSYAPWAIHSQAATATPLKTDNSTSNSFIHANIKQCRSKTWDMDAIMELALR
jgi:hypothetical protein